MSTEYIDHCRRLFMIDWRIVSSSHNAMTNIYADLVVDGYMIMPLPVRIPEWIATKVFNKSKRGFYMAFFKSDSMREMLRESFNNHLFTGVDTTGKSICGGFNDDELTAIEAIITKWEKLP